MSRHVSGIHQWNGHGGKTPASYRARCDTCEWVGPLRKHPRDAQSDCMEHGGGRLRVTERQYRRPDPREGMDEMFPGTR